MKIRSLLLLISVLGAVSSASVVLFFMNEKLSTQEEDNNALPIFKLRRRVGSDY